MLSRCILLALIVFALSGCAFGNKHDYRSAVPFVLASNDKTIAIATYDQRPEIIMGKSSSEYCGVIRGGFGNPFQVVTESGLPLADDMSTALVKAFSEKGYKVRLVSTKHTDSLDEVMTKLASTSSDKLLLLVLNEWYSDTFAGTDLIYDINLRVANSKGKLIASGTAKSIENIGGSALPAKSSGPAVQTGFKSVLEKLLNYNEDVNKALL